MRYPSDNFYKGHSLSFDLNRSGKDEFQIIQNQLKELGINPTPRVTILTLDLIQLIQYYVVKDGTKETARYLKHLKQNQITGTPVPVDISLAYHAFERLAHYFDPYVTMEVVGGNFLIFSKKILGLIRKNKAKKPLDVEAERVIKKIVKKETNKILKKVVELQTEIQYTSSKNGKKIKKHTKPQKRKTTRKAQ